VESTKEVAAVGRQRRFPRKIFQGKGKGGEATWSNARENKQTNKQNKINPPKRQTQEKKKRDGRLKKKERSEGQAYEITEATGLRDSRFGERARSALLRSPLS